MVGNCLRSVSHSNGVRAAAPEIGRMFELDQVPVIRFRYPILHMPVFVPHTAYRAYTSRSPWRTFVYCTISELSTIRSRLRKYS